MTSLILCLCLCAVAMALADPPPLHPNLWPHRNLAEDVLGYLSDLRDREQRINFATKQEVLHGSIAKLWPYQKFLGLTFSSTSTSEPPSMYSRTMEIWWQHGDARQHRAADFVADVAIQSLYVVLQALLGVHTWPLSGTWKAPQKLMRPGVVCASQSALTSLSIWCRVSCWNDTRQTGWDHQPGILCVQACQALEHSAPSRTR